MASEIVTVASPNLSRSITSIFLGNSEMLVASSMESGALSGATTEAIVELA